MYYRQHAHSRPENVGNKLRFSQFLRLVFHFVFPYVGKLPLSIAHVSTRPHRSTTTIVQVQYHMVPPAAGAHAADVETSFRLENGRLLAVTRLKGRSPAPIVPPVSAPSPSPPLLGLSADGGGNDAISGEPRLPHHRSAEGRGGGGGGGGAHGFEMGMTTPAGAPFYPFAPGVGGAARMASPPVAAQPLLSQAVTPLEMMEMVASSEEKGRVMGEGDGGDDDDLFSLNFGAAEF